MKSKKFLDFIIIGAQKSGTTTLFNILVEHPNIFMPHDKGLRFFNVDEFYNNGWDWYLQKVFSSASQDQLWGKATVQYMCYPQSPERIAKQLPKIKLISILRNPIDRAFSHFKMKVRRDYEKRSFETCIQSQLKPEVLEESRLYPNNINSYISWGEYGRILTEFMRYFPRNQLLILSFEELEHNPKSLFTRIYDFLGVNFHLTNTLGQRFHKGGTQTKFPIMLKIKKVLPIQTLKKILPLNMHRNLWRIYFSFEQWNTISNETSQIPLSKHTLNALQKHYIEDSDLLKKFVDPYWLPFPKPKIFSLSSGENINK